MEAVRGRIAEFQLRDLERCAFDADFLHVAFANWIGDDRVFQRDLHAVRGEQLLYGLAGLIHCGARFGEGAVEERKFDLRMASASSESREPRNIVEVNGDARRFLDVIGDENAGDACLEIETYFGEEPALHELVGGGLQIILANLRAGTGGR